MTMTAVMRTERRQFRGASSLEAIVSFTLLSAVLTCAAPLVARHTRLLAGQRHYRLALDELSNQLERLAALPPAELPAELAALTLSDFAAARLPDAQLQGQLTDAEVGQRLTLLLTWDEPGRRESPLTLSTWLAAGTGRPQP